MKRFLSDKWLSFGVVVLGTFMCILDTSIVNIAVPKMMAVFNVGTDKIEWVLTSYMLTLAVIMPLTGLLGDKFGLKRTYVFALATFTFGSFLCGISWNLSSMIIARVVQAVGGGMIMPVSMTLIYRIVPREKIGLAMGFWGIAAMAAPAIGPSLGGYLIDYVNWQLIFNVNIPIGILGVACSIILLDDYKGERVHKIDYAGIILSGVSMLTLVLALNNGNSEGWTSPYIILLFVTAGLSMIGFVFAELNHPEPVLDLSILKNYRFSLSLAMLGINTIALFGGVFLIPIYLQNLKGFSPLECGLIMLPSALASAIFMPISGKIFDRYGAKYIVLVGMTVLLISSFELSRLSLDSTIFAIMAILTVRGAGLGMAMMPIQTYGMSTIPNARIGKASALSNTFRQVTAAFGIALLSSIMTHRQYFHSARLAENLAMNNPAGSLLSTETIRNALGHGLSLESARTVLSRWIGSTLVKQSYVMSLNDTLLITAYTSVAGLFLGLMISKSDKKQ